MPTHYAGMPAAQLRRTLRGELHRAAGESLSVKGPLSGDGEWCCLTDDGTSFAPLRPEAALEILAGVADDAGRDAIIAAWKAAPADMRVRDSVWSAAEWDRYDQERSAH